MAVEGEPRPGLARLMTQNDGGPVVEARVVVAEAVYGGGEGRMDRGAGLGKQVDPHMDCSPLNTIFALDGERVRIVPAARLVVPANPHAGAFRAHVAEEEVGPAARIQVGGGSQPSAAHAQVEDGVRALCEGRGQHRGEAAPVAGLSEPGPQSRSP